MQDASFIISVPGHVKSDASCGEEENEILFGHKLHGAMDVDFGLTHMIEVTTAKVHDSQVDLASEGEARYADKGLFRCEDKRVRCCHEKSHIGPSPKL